MNRRHDPPGRKPRPRGGRAHAGLCVLAAALLAAPLAAAHFGAGAATAPADRAAPPATATSLLPAVQGPATRPAATRPAPRKRYQHTVAAPTAEVKPEGCVTAACHPDVKDHKVIHGPVNVNACDACHKLTDAGKHRYELTRPEDKLCTFCHKFDLPKANVVHEPVKSGSCAACHDPHGGFDKNFVRSASLAELCRSCHLDPAAGKKSVHGPVAAGACGTCHAPHSSERPKLLAKQGRELCLSCHQEWATQLKTAKVMHQPSEGDCQQCHDPHASNYGMMVRKSPAELCTASCHDNIKKAITQATFKHSAVSAESGCVNCHTAHAGDLGKLMKARPATICLKCHEKPVKSAAGAEVAGVPEIADARLVQHGPLKDGSCGGCHNVHGSEVSRLLAKPYPETFYESFEVEKYGLCFSCHDKQLAQTASTTGLTRFRDGAVNLHFVHVNKDKRGRSCRACHSTHASPQAVHIRPSVPYGAWSLPINYTQTASGGTCSPGCHKPLSYDRVTPVGNTIVTPTTQPAAVRSGTETKP